MMSARARLSLAADQADLDEVANPARHCRGAGVQQLGDLGRGQQARVRAEQRDEDPGRHPGESGFAEHRGEALDEPVHRGVIASQMVPIGCPVTVVAGVLAGLLRPVGPPGPVVPSGTAR